MNVKHKQPTPERELELAAKRLELRSLRQKVKYHDARGDSAKAVMFRLQHDKLQEEMEGA